MHYGVRLSDTSEALEREKIEPLSKVRGVRFRLLLVTLSGLEPEFAP